MILAVLALAFGVRLISINQSFWLDEAINVVYAKQLSFWQFVSSYPIGDFHPPGWFAILWVTTHIFGSSEISARFPSLLLSVATVYLIYLIGKQLFNKRVGLISALLLSISPLHIYYSQEARMYALAAFAVSLSTYFLIKLASDIRLKNFLTYGISLGFVFYSDYLAYLILPVHLIYFFIFRRNAFLKYLASFAGSLILGLPLIPLFIKQLATGVQTAAALPGWAGVVGGSGIKDGLLLPVKILIGRVSIDNNLVYLFVVLAISLPYLMVLTKVRKLNDKFFLLTLWLALPPTSAFLISFFVPVFAYFRVLFILPAFYLLVAAGAVQFKTALSKTLIIIMAVVQIVASGVYLFNPEFQREDWRSAVRYVEASSANGAVSVFVTDGQTAPYTYYAKSVPWTFENRWQSQDLQTIWFFRYLQPVFDPEEKTLRSIESAGYRKLEEKDFNGIIIWRYSKNI